MAVFSTSISKMAAVLQILWVLPQGFCYKSVKAIQYLYPGLKINEQSWEIHAMPTSVPGLPPRMTADKCIMHGYYLTFNQNLETHPHSLTWFVSSLEISDFP